MNVYKVTPKKSGVVLKIVAQDEYEAIEISGYQNGEADVQLVTTLERYLKQERKYQ